MTAVRRSTPSLSAVPTSQNTAPVAEFRCLFTHDVRKKQKKWQDGFLKFHTFNKRIMVYDAARTFVGDTYWKDGDEVHEGDELNLDKGVMVEVADAMGVTCTDLTPLLEKKPRDAPESGPQAPVPRRLPPPAVPLSNVLRNGSQLRHKSLNTLLGTPKGPIGKAVPIRSPYEQRLEKENDWAQDRAAKRQKTRHRPTDPEVSDTAIAGKPSPSRATSSRRDACTTKLAAPQLPRHTVPRGATVITLDSEQDPPSSEITLPSTLPGMQSAKGPVYVTSAPTVNQKVQEAPVPKKPRLPKGKIPLPGSKPNKPPQQTHQSSSPSVSVSNRLSNVEFAIDSARARTEEKEAPVPRASGREPKAKMKALRLAPTNRRGMLLCQEMPPAPEKARKIDQEVTKKRKKKKKPRALETAERIEASTTESGPGLLDDDALLFPGGDFPSPEPAKATNPKRKAQTSKANLSKKLKTVERSPLSSPDPFEDIEVIHGLMDQKLLAPPADVNTTKPGVGEKMVSASRLEDSVARPVPVAASLKPVLKKAQTKAARPTIETPVDLPAPNVHNIASPKDSIPDRLSSISLSPTKPPPTTGGFGRKSKPQVPLMPPPTKPTTVALPPHPLVANKNGPLMSTAQLSLLLQKPPPPLRLEQDPITDDLDPAVSPSKRPMRRSQSENDAPIPSAASEWESRNLTASDRGTSKATAARGGGVGLAALVKKTDPRKKFQRSKTLGVDTGVGGNGAGAGVLSPPPVDGDVGPWSTDAFDLFDWRPPVKEAEEEGVVRDLV